MAGGHFGGFLVGDGNADPGLFRIHFNEGAALGLELEESSGAQEAGDFGDVAFDDFVAGDVLEDVEGEGEIEGRVGGDG